MFNRVNTVVLELIHHTFPKCMAPDGLFKDLVCNTPSRNVFKDESLSRTRVVVIKKPSITAFFPVHCEEGTVALMTNRLLRVLPTLTDDYEIIIVDDCSTDRTGEIADQLAKEHSSVRVIHHKENLGYGGALRSGFAAAAKDLIFYTDGDAQYDVNELTQFFPFIKDYDVVSAYQIKREDPFHRRILSKLYYSVLKVFFNIHVRDVSSDFRLFRKEVIDTIDLESDSGTICIELMKKVQDAGFRIKELPVHHYPRISGESAFFTMRSIVKTWAELIPLWWKLVVRKTARNKRHGT